MAHIHHTNGRWQEQLLWHYTSVHTLLVQKEVTHQCFTHFYHSCLVWCRDEMDIVHLQLPTHRKASKMNAVGTCSTSWICCHLFHWKNDQRHHDRTLLQRRDLIFTSKFKNYPFRNGVGWRIGWDGAKSKGNTKVQYGFGQVIRRSFSWKWWCWSKLVYRYRLKLKLPYSVQYFLECL